MASSNNTKVMDNTVPYIMCLTWEESTWGKSSKEDPSSWRIYNFKESTNKRNLKNENNEQSKKKYCRDTSSNKSFDLDGKFSHWEDGMSYWNEISSLDDQPSSWDNQPDNQPSSWDNQPDNQPSSWDNQPDNQPSSWDNQPDNQPSSWDNQSTIYGSFSSTWDKDKTLNDVPKNCNIIPLVNKGQSAWEDYAACPACQRLYFHSHIQHHLETCYTLDGDIHTDSIIAFDTDFFKLRTNECQSESSKTATLVDLCSNSIAQNCKDMDIEKLIKLWMMCHQHTFQRLEKSCIEVLSGNILDIINSHSYQSLDAVCKEILLIKCIQTRKNMSFSGGLKLFEEALKQKFDNLVKPLGNQLVTKDSWISIYVSALQSTELYSVRDYCIKFSNENLTGFDSICNSPFIKLIPDCLLKQLFQSNNSSMTLPEFRFNDL